MYIDDGGANVPGGVEYDAANFYHLDLKSDMASVRDAGGHLCPVKGIGTIRLQVRTTKGVVTMDVRQVLYAPEFSVRVISHRQLKREGWSFADGTAGTYVTNPKIDVTIPFHERDGLFYWKGRTIRQKLVSQQAVINSISWEATVNSIRTEKEAAVLLDMLNSNAPDNTNQRQHKCRHRLAELGTYTARCPTTDPVLALHCALMHCSPDKTAKFLRTHFTSKQIALTFGAIANIWCNSCKSAKVKAKGPPRGAKSQAHRPTATVFGQRTHTDVAGPFPVTSRHSNFRYEIVFVDEATGFMTLYGMDNKGQVPTMVRRYFNWVKTKTPAPSSPRELGRPQGTSWVPDLGRVSSMRSDNDRVYTSDRARAVYDDLGITFETISPHSSWQLGYAERAFQTIHTKAIAALMAARLPPAYWYLAHLQAVATNNILPSSSNRGGISPAAAAFGERVGLLKDFKWLRIFGSPVWCHQFKKTNKLIPRGAQGLWVGYDHTQQAHRVAFEPSVSGTARASMQVSQHVSFERPTRLMPTVASGELPFDAQPTDFAKHGRWFHDFGVGEFQKGVDTSVASKPIPLMDPMGTMTTATPSVSADDDPLLHPVADDVIGMGGGAAAAGSQLTDVEACPLIGDDWFVNTVLPPGVRNGDAPLTMPSLPGVADDTEKQVEPTMPMYADDTEYLDSDEWTCATTIGDIYRNLGDAMKTKFAPMFKQSWAKERDQLFKSGIIERVRVSDVPEGSKIHRSISLHQIKQSPQGPIPKSRWCFDGSSQREPGVDHGLTCTATVRWSTIRLIVAYAAAMVNVKLYQSDLPNAYMQAPTPGVRYMHFPQGASEYDDDGEKLCLQVNGNIYGAKDGGRMFTDHRDEWLKSIGFKQSEYDPALFTREAEGDMSRVVVGYWIDDGIFAANEAAKDWFEGKLDEQWARDNGTGAIKTCEVQEATFAIGATFEQEDGRIKMHHGKMVESLVADFQEHLGEKYPYAKTTPFPSGAAVIKADCPPEHEPLPLRSKYRSGVASCLYLACTSRPDIAKHCSELGKVQANPGEKHWEYLLHLISYLSGTPNDGVQYVANERSNELVAFCDASWADDQDDRRSTAGYVSYMNGAPVNWHSRIMSAIALSSAESELYSATDAAKDVTHLRWVINDITGEPQPGPTTLYEDNNAVIAIASDRNKSISTRTKHIAARYFWCRAKVNDGTILLVRCDTTEQVADALTKVSLSRETFTKFRNRMVTHT
jgi:hypothetical protein